MQNKKFLFGKMDKIKLILVLTSLDSEKKAREIAETLVKEKLAACVSLFSDVESFYFWEEKLCREKEIFLFIKTREDLFNHLKERLLEIHPYETPEIISLNIDNFYEKYAKWVVDETLHYKSD
ncbi:MAG: divalent-cation tolerance protein CutA [Candidatus Schekmanbacteria bacterium]|nr:MAG: divalent-cation tolerance protein CutA [Candidatus Schekmanbacteria bacterium]